MDELDYEQKQSYELVIRATDSVSGVSGECLKLAFDFTFHTLHEIDLVK